jgi:hypothetical protein
MLVLITFSRLERNVENTVWTRLEDTEGVGGTEWLSYKVQELLKRLQNRHGEYAQFVVKTEKDVDDVPNVIQSMILFQQAKDRGKVSQDRGKSSEDQTKTTNKVVSCYSVDVGM